MLQARLFSASTLLFSTVLYLRVFIVLCPSHSLLLELASRVWDRAGPSPHRAQGIIRSDQIGPNINRAAILLAQPDPISS